MWGASMDNTCSYEHEYEYGTSETNANAVRSIFPSAGEHFLPPRMLLAGVAWAPIIGKGRVARINVICPVMCDDPTAA